MRSIVWDIVDTEGPITFKVLCERVARRHGFQRTGSQIKEIIQRALKRTRSQSNGKGDDAVIWPNNEPVSDWVQFRGLTVNGETRHWADVPIPEKIGLARRILATSEPDPEDAMREAIGMARLRTKTREEVKNLLARAKAQLAESESDPHPSNVSYLDRRGR